MKGCSWASRERPGTGVEVDLSAALAALLSYTEVAEWFMKLGWDVSLIALTNAEMIALVVAWMIAMIITLCSRF